MNTSARPLEAALRPRGHGHVGAAATLWSVGQQREGLRRAGRYGPDPRRRPRSAWAALVAHIVDRYSTPGQVAFDTFGGSGVTTVEAAYAGRHSVGIESAPCWYDLTPRNTLFAYGHVACGEAWLNYADARDLKPVHRRLRDRVDLVVATPPSRFAPTHAGGLRDDADIVADLDFDMTRAVRCWMPLVCRDAVLVITTRMVTRPDCLLDHNVPNPAAADRAGLHLPERAAALGVER
jgi:hypothetical protein